MLALVCSVALEAAPVEARLGSPRPITVGRRRAMDGTLAGRRVLLLPGGMGKTNAAQALTALLERHPVTGVIGFGVGGAYPGSGLEPGGLAVATREIYGDEGVAAPDGWLTPRDIGIPLVERAGGPLYDRFEMEAARVERAVAALREAGLAPVAGPFVTVSACSGTLARGAELATRHGAVCESMEGAACAHVSALYDVPYLELRGISNPVEDRDLSRWRLADAARVAAAGVEAVVARWGADPRRTVHE